MRTASGAVAVQVARKDRGRDLYGFRTSLTVRHRDMVDTQPMSATVSRWSIQSYLNQIPMLRHVSRSRSVYALSLKSTTAHPLVR